MNVDLTDLKYPSDEDLAVAVGQAGKDGSITLSSVGTTSLIEDLHRLDEAMALRDLAADLLKGVVLQGAARAAIPIPEDVRALVRLARELDAELKTPTPWPVEKPAPEEEDD